MLDTAAVGSGMSVQARRAAVAASVLVVATAAGLGAWALLGGTDKALTPADPAAVYDPVLAGEEPPAGYRALLERDQIEPIYDPEFTSAQGVEWPADSLVIGIAGQDTSKAYPVTFLNRHELVIDSLEGDPLLVSW